VIPTATGYLDGSNALPPPISVVEDEFSHLDVLKQPIRLASGAWATTNTVNTELLSMEVPDIFGTFPTIHKQLLQLYTFYKFSLRFRIVVNTTRFHAGKLIALYDPFNTFGTGLDRSPDVWAATGYPHVKLDAAVSNSAEIDVPFENLVTFLTTTSPELSPPMGILRVLVFNPLQAAAGATDPITFNVFVSAAEVQLHLPTLPHVPQFSTPPTMNINLKEIVSTAGGIAKTATGAIADIKSGNISGLFKRAKDFFSLDRPANADSRQGNCLATISPPAHMLGLDQSVRLGATQDGAYLETDFSTAPVTDMSIYNIIQRPMLVNQYTWSSASPTDTIIDTIFVNPGFCHQDVQVPDVSALCHNTFLSYFATMFEFWRGGIKYTFDFAATNFNTGRLMVAFVPTQGLVPLPGVVSNVTGLSNTPHIIFDLEQHKEFSFTVPYVASTPRKRCVNGLQALTPTTDSTVTGTLVIIVVDPLTTSNNLPPTIQFNMYMSAAEDFRFYAPRISPSTHFAEDPVSETERITMNSAAMQDESVMREVQPAPSIVKGAPSISTPEYFGEVINDVRDLCRRYFRYPTSITMAADPDRTGMVIGKSFFGAHPDSYYSTNFFTNIPFSSHSFATLISRVYVLWSGSIRWKFVFVTDRTKNLQAIATYAFSNNGIKFVDADNLSGYPQFIANASQDSALEIELPFYTHFAQCLTQDDPVATAYPASIYTPGYVQLELSSYAGSFTADRVNITAYHAIGDDFAFRFLVAPPNTIELNVTE